MPGGDDCFSSNECLMLRGDFMDSLVSTALPWNNDPQEISVSDDDWALMTLMNRHRDHRAHRVIVCIV